MSNEGANALSVVTFFFFFGGGGVHPFEHNYTEQVGQFDFILKTQFSSAVD